MAQQGDAPDFSGPGTIGQNEAFIESGMTVGHLKNLFNSNDDVLRQRSRKILLSYGVDVAFIEESPNQELDISVDRFLRGDLSNDKMQEIVKKWCACKKPSNGNPTVVPEGTSRSAPATAATASAPSSAKPNSVENNSAPVGASTVNSPQQPQPADTPATSHPVGTSVPIPKKEESMAGRGGRGGRGAASTQSTQDKGFGERGNARGRGRGTDTKPTAAERVAAALAGAPSLGAAPTTHNGSMAKTQVPPLEQMTDEQAANHIALREGAKKIKDGAWAYKEGSGLAAIGQEHYNVAIAKTKAKAGDEALSLVKLTAPVLARIGTRSDAQLPLVPRKTMPSKVLEHTSYNTFITPMYLPSTDMRTAYYNEAGMVKAWMEHANGAIVLWEGPHTQWLVLCGVQKEKVVGKIENRCLFIDAATGEDVPEDCRWSFQTKDDCIVQGIYTELAKHDCLDNRRALTKEGDEGLYEGRSLKEMDRSTFMVGRVWSFTAGNQAAHRARIHLHAPKAKTGPEMEKFRRDQFELGLDIQNLYPGSETLMLGNDILMWVPRVWDRKLQQEIAQYQLVRRCFTEVPIQQAVAPLGAMPSNAAVSSVTEPVIPAEEITVWGKALNGIPGVEEWRKVAEATGGRLVTCNNFTSQLRFPLAAWLRTSTNRVTATSDWCRLTTVAPLRPLA